MTTKNIDESYIFEKFIKEYKNNNKLNLPSDLIEYFTSNIQQGKTSIDSLFNIISIMTLFKVLKENDYLETLCNKYKQLNYIDDYGEINSKQWFSEINKFKKNLGIKIFNQVHSNIDQEYHFFAKKLGMTDILSPDYSKAIDPLAEDSLYYETYDATIFIDDEINSLITCLMWDDDNRVFALRFNISDIDPQINIDKDIDGIEYEQIIKDKFETMGWQARISKASGDQGADIFLKKKHITAIVQCKYYSKPVGNKAVQEAHSAKSFYNTKLAIVVTNNSYTTSARQLAQSTQVILLQDFELEKFDKRINEIILKLI